MRRLSKTSSHFYKQNLTIMYRKIYLPLILFAFLFLNACKTKTEPEFKSIFNGQNLDGWYFKIRSGDSIMAQKVYAVENEMVHIFNESFPDTIDLNTGKNDTHGLFYTHKKYSKFHLKFEYKWGKKIANNFGSWQYDAGCYYHVYDDKIWPKGIEYQIRYNHTNNKNHTGDFWASDSLTWCASTDTTAFVHPNNGGKWIRNKRGELYGLPNAPFQAINDKWNQCEVIVMADKYCIHKLNGEIVNIGKDLAIAEGVIGFQSETAEIFYRNIQIKEFEEILPISKFLK